MFFCHGLMLYVIARMFGRCLTDCLKNTPEEDYIEEVSHEWEKLSRLDQAMKLFELKQKNFQNKNMEFSSELYKFCLRKKREPNKTRFGKYNKPKAHQSWVIIRKNFESEGKVYHLPLSSQQIEDILEKVDFI